LDVSVLLVVSGPDGVVDYDSVYRGVLVCLDNGLFEDFFIDLVEVEVETAGDGVKC
jgi:hypothetical protein